MASQVLPCGMVDIFGNELTLVIRLGSNDCQMIFFSILVLFVIIGQLGDLRQHIPLFGSNEVVSFSS